MENRWYAWVVVHVALRTANACENERNDAQWAGLEQASQLGHKIV